MAPTICDCGLVPLPVGVEADWRDGVEHTEGACVEVPIGAASC